MECPCQNKNQVRVSFEKLLTPSPNQIFKILYHLFYVTHQLKFCFGIRVHNEKKSFKCSLCDNKFTTKRSVYSHIQSVHSGVREHKCDLCGILFQKFSNLNSHYDAVHEKVKNHKCTECGKSFSQKSNLKTHLDYVHR